MAIFPHIELEDIVQVNDRTRLSAIKSFVSKDEAAVTLVEIEPESGSGFIDVTGAKQADWFWTGSIPRGSEDRFGPGYHGWCPSHRDSNSSSPNPRSRQTILHRSKLGI